MKRNDVRKISINGLKLYKNKTILLIASITISSIILFSAIGLLNLNYNHKKIELEKQYGSYHYVINEADQDQLNQIHNPFLRTNTMKIYGSNENGNIGSIDEFNLIPLQIVEGRMPEKEDEVCIEINHVNGNLGDSINISYTNQKGEVVEKEYKVVGKTNDYSSQFYALRIWIDKWTNEDGSTSSRTNSQMYDNSSCQYFIKELDEDHQSIVFVKEIKEQGQIKGDNVYKNSATMSYTTMNEGMSIHQEAEYLREMILLSLSVVIVIISFFGISQLNNEQKGRFKLLRGLGATSFQLMSINMIQISLVLLICLPIGLCTGIFITKLFSLYLHYPFVLMWLDILSGISFIVLACIIGILFPMITSINESLINRKKKVKKVNIHSSHRLNPFTLALRHNYIHSLRNIIYIIIMVTSIYIFVSNIYFVIYPNVIQLDPSVSATFSDELSPESQQLIDQVQIPYEFNYDTSDMKYMNEYPCYYTIVSGEYLDLAGDDLDAYIHGNAIAIELGEYYYNKKTYDFYTVDQVQNIDTSKSEWEHIETPKYQLGQLIDGLKIVKIDIYPSESYQIYVSLEGANKLGLNLNNNTIIYHFNNNEEYEEINKLMNGLRMDPNFNFIIDGMERYNEELAKQSQKKIESLMISFISILIITIMVYQNSSSTVNTKQREISLYRAIGYENQKIILKILLEPIQIIILITIILVFILSIIARTVRIIDPGVILILSTLIVLITFGTLVCYYLPVKKALKERILYGLNIRE